MGAHKYWRVVEMRPYDGGREIELSAFWLLGTAGRVDTGGTLTASIAPLVGSVSSLADTDLTTQVVLDSRTTLQWQFATSVDVTDIRLGSTFSRTRFLFSAKLQWSDDGAVWVTADDTPYSAISWPSPRALTNSTSWTDRLLSLATDQWLDDETPVVSVSGQVSSWGGRGRNVFSFTQADTALQPTILPSGLNGRRGLSFTNQIMVDGSNQALAATRNISNLWSVFVFDSAVGSAAGANLILSVPSGTGNPRFEANAGYGNGSDALRPYVYGTNTDGGPWYAAIDAYQGGGNVSLYAIDYANGQMSVQTNGKPAVVTTFSPSGNTEDTISLGAIGLGGTATNAANRFRGTMYAMLMGVGTTPTAGDIERLMGAMCWRYGLQAKLPANHRFYAGAPTRIEEDRIRGGSPVFNIWSASSNGADSAFSGGAVVGEAGAARADFRFDPQAKGRIVGTVKEKSTPDNVPLMRRIRLYRDRDGMLVRETWSTPAGDYVFEHIEEGEPYTVLALDHTHHYRAVVADNLTLENGSVEIAQ